ncbi:arabinogalactan endo-beta-1,4-galactanase [Abditibacteriota bacterium]|nr:arabinogalactan endo-beta-1,4-galactanase [Abditibacteriota bacterium]
MEELDALYNYSMFSGAPQLLIPCFMACLWFALGTPPAHSQTNAAPLAEFATGADLSMLPHHEARGIQYFDGDKATDLLAIAKSNGWKIIRVRLWVEPNAKPEYQVSNLENVTQLGKRIKAVGLQFLLDIHYSDTWADPGHQKKPAAWADLTFPPLEQRVHDYSRDVIVHLRENGAMPDIVQVGNEIKNGLLYGSGINEAGPQPGGGFWEPDKGGIERGLRLFAAGARGVREGSSQAPLQIMLHVPDGQDTGFIKWYFSMLDKTAHEANPPLNLDYDLIGLSYYPAAPWDEKAGYEPWHLSHLTDSMAYLATTWGKPIMVVETNWPHAGTPRTLPGTPEYSFTPEGQMKFYQTLVGMVRAVPKGLGRGVMAWEIDTLNWDSIFDAKGNALPAVRALGQK